MSLFPLAKELGFKISLLDIGGGFPWDCKTGTFDFYTFCEPLREILEKVDKDITIFGEPGRFMSTTCMTLVHSVMGLAEREGKIWYYMDEGFYGAYAEMRDKIDYPISTPYNSGELFESALTGPTCDA